MQAESFWPPVDRTTRDYYGRIAYQLLNVSDPGQFSFELDDLTEIELHWAQKNMGASGVGRGVVNRTPSFLECDTGATAGVQATLTRGSIPGGLQAPQIPSGTSGVWFWAIRFAPNGFAAYSTAQTGLSLRMADRLTITTSRGDLGKIQGTANWAFKADGGAGATIDSGVAATASAAARVLMCWRVGGMTHLALDGLEVGTPSDTFPTQPSCVQLYYTNGTDAASRSWLPDWVAFGSNGRSAS